MHDRGLVDFCNAPQNSIPQLLPGLNANVTEERASHFAKQRLHNFEPEPVRGCMHILESIGPCCEVRLWFLWKYAWSGYPE